MAHDCRLREFLAAFAERELGLLGELRHMLRHHFELARRLQPARGHGFELGGELIDRPIRLADGLAHDRIAAGLLHSVDEILDSGGNHATDAREDGLGERLPPFGMQD